MALVPCKECKKDVSEQAAACPHCGVSYPAVSNEDIAITAKAVQLKVETFKMRYIAGLAFFGGFGLILLNQEQAELGMWLIGGGVIFYLLTEIVRNLDERKLKKNK
ncbi:MAG: hypothetical protein RL368_1771 [Pseudomonadota bacterium]